MGRCQLGVPGGALDGGCTEEGAGLCIGGPARSTQRWHRAGVKMWTLSWNPGSCTSEL